MFKRMMIRAAVLTTLLMSCASASATVLSFTGSMTGLGAAGPDPVCSPLPIHGMSTGSGTSSLGTFTYSHDICFNPLGGPFQGTFGIDFGTGSISGLLAGSDTATTIPAVFDVNWTYTILAGTGQFANAGGTFTGVGTVDSRVFPAPMALLFAGTINAPAVPEPGTWGLMLVGFAALGLRLRGRGRRTPALAQLA